MEACERDGTAGLDLAGDVLVVELAMGLERNDRRLGVGPVFILEGACKARSAVTSMEFEPLVRPEDRLCG